MRSIYSVLRNFNSEINFSKRNLLYFKIFSLSIFLSINQLNAQVKIELGASVGGYSYNNAPYDGINDFLKNTYEVREYGSNNELKGGYKIYPDHINDFYNFDLRFKKGKSTFVLAYSFAKEIVGGFSFNEKGSYEDQDTYDQFSSFIKATLREKQNIQSVELFYQYDLLSILKKAKFPITFSGGIGLNHFSIKRPLPENRIFKSIVIFPEEPLPLDFYKKHRVLFITKAELRWWYLKASVEYSPFLSRSINENLALVNEGAVRLEKKGMAHARFFAFRFGVQVPIHTIAKKAKVN